MAHIECWLGSFVIIRGSIPVLLGNPINFVIFKGEGGPDPLPPSGSTHGMTPIKGFKNGQIKSLLSISFKNMFWDNSLKNPQHVFWLRNKKNNF